MKSLAHYLNELEYRLEARVPPAYRAFVRSETADFIAKRGFDPKTLLVLNLELRELDRNGETLGRFFLNGDGCGNYYFVAPQVDPERVLLWSHDPPGIEDPKENLGPYLRVAEQDNRIDWPPDDGWLYLCRTPTYRESILAPIALDEWIAAVNSTKGVKYIGYREGKNPFTRELIRVESPGLVEVLGQENVHISFHYGRAMLKDSLRAIGAELALKLGANLLGRSH